MAGTATIATVVLLVGAGAAVGIARQQGWSGFGEFGQGIAPPLKGVCKAQISFVGWSTGVRARALAETRALVGWSKKARRHGPGYNRWHNARSRHMECKIISAKTAKCTARGRPCPSSTGSDSPDNLF